MGKIALIGKANVDEVFAAAACQVNRAEKYLLIGLEVNKNRVDGNHGGQQRLATGHQVAGGHHGPACKAGDRCTNLGKLKVQAGKLHRSLGHGNVGVSLGIRSNCLIMLFLGDGPALEQFPGALDFTTRQVGLGLCTLEFGLGLGQRGLVRTLVNDKQDIALGYLAAFHKAHFLDVAVHPRANFHRLRRFNAAAELVPVVYFPNHDFSSAHLRRRHLPVPLGGAGVTGHQGHG